MGQADSPADRIVKRYSEERENGQKSPSEAWRATYDWWIASNPTGKGDPSQSWRSASGKAFEKIVHKELKLQIASLPVALHVFSWSELDAEIQQGVLAERVWKPHSLKEPVIVPSMVDLVVASGESKEKLSHVVAVYSCKTSLAERYQQDLFWAQRLRERRIRFCLVTLDEECTTYATAQTSPDAGKSLRLAVALYDRIYLFTDDAVRHEPQVFRQVAQLGSDLCRWSEVL
ncbi:MAG: hypothetical protein HPY54_12055 [Chthonomonadetes bacterium]|nr:hypothetical protein [Chthonomonadetes bacterium]